MSTSVAKTKAASTSTAKPKPLPKFRALDLTELAAVDSLRGKSLNPFRGIDVQDLRVHYRWQRDGFCVCTVQASVVSGGTRIKGPARVWCWSGVSKRAPVDPHNEIRGRMLAFVRAAQSTPATW